MKQRVSCRNSSGRSRLLHLFIAVSSILYLASAPICAQTQVGNPEQASYITKTSPTQVAAPAPVLKDYRKVSIGMSADMLLDAWGKPAMEYPDGYHYEMSDSETVQIVMGPDKKITAIAITFIEGKGAPPFAGVFGEAITPEKRENGSVYRMVRYPDAGYWVSYYAGPEKNADVSLTMRKL